MSNNFKTFLIIDIIISVILAVAGFVVFPFLGWAIDSTETICHIMVSFLVIAGLLLIISIILFIIRTKNVVNHNLYQIFLTLAISLGVVFGIHCIRFYSADLAYSGRKWGNCIYNSIGTVFNRIGVQKFHQAFPAYVNISDNYRTNKVFVRFDITRKETGSTGNMIYNNENVKYHEMNMIIHAVVYDDNGNYMRKCDTKNYYYYDFDSYPNGYYYGGNHYKKLNFYNVYTDSENCVSKAICEQYLKLYNLSLAY